MTTASLYVRLSRQAGESNLSLVRMVDEARDLAQRLGYEVIAEHVDNGISGAVRDRPEFLAWLSDARSGAADCLVTYHADRVTREGVNVAAMVLDVVEGKDSTTGQVVRPPVRLATVDGLDSRDESYRLRLVFAAEIARAERERITARNRASQKGLREAGRFMGGPTPYGTRLVVREGRKYLEPDEAEAAILREVASRLLRGDGVKTVVRWLNESGHRTRKGNEWIRTSLLGTLRSEAAREHVFDLATIRALDERLTRSETPTTAQRGGRPVRWLLAGGSAVCGSCGRIMRTTSYKRRGESVMRYACSGGLEGKTCAGMATIYAEALDAEVERSFLEHYGDGFYWEERVTIAGAEDLDDAERADVAARKALDEDLTADNLAAAQAVRARLEAARAQPVTRHREIVASEQTYGEKWAAADLAERAAMVSAALAQSVVVRSRPASRVGRTTRAVQLDRAEIVWRDEVNPDD